MLFQLTTKCSLGSPLLMLFNLRDIIQEIHSHIMSEFFIFSELTQQDERGKKTANLV